MEMLTPPICTFESLHEWTSRMFEKLGWMVLARDHPASIQCYLKSLQYLQSQIHQKYKETQDHDRRVDLEELGKQVLSLRTFVETHMILKPSKHNKLVQTKKKVKV